MSRGDEMRLSAETRDTRVPGLLVAPMSHLRQEAVERFVVSRRHLEAHQYPAVLGSVVPVVEETDVPASAEVGEKAEQGARPFGKLEAEQALVAREARPPTM